MKKSQRENISKALKGRKLSEEHKKRISEALKGKPKSPEHKIKCGKANAKYTRKLSKEELNDLYWNKKLAMNKIAKRINADPTTIRNWLIEYGLGTRSLKESQPIRKMPKIYKKTKKTLKMGTRTGSYYNHIRPKILKRDNYKCTECGSQEYIIVHHIKPLEEGGTHEPDNLITLCRSCHKKKHPVSEETRRKMSKSCKKAKIKTRFKKGHVPWNKVIESE